MADVEIKTGDTATVVRLSKCIPEFREPYEESTYLHRLNERTSLILIAHVGGEAVGFKVGYNKDMDGSFYSWMGGVLPAYRRHGIAQKLAQTQEEWAKRNGFTSIRLKTRNSHKSMLNFALTNGFNIVDLETRELPEEHRIILEKRFHL